MIGSAAESDEPLGNELLDGRDPTATRSAQPNIATTDPMDIALELVHSGACAPLIDETSELDLEFTPLRMTGFDTAFDLWPHQRAAAGRLVEILIRYFATLLAFEMGLGKTLIVIGRLRDSICVQIHKSSQYSQ
jgi:hypothetical protein